tara:strand:+ start:311 stop:490 length:180 start_codon:yes stop_codon:yes gene_type:complete
MATDDQVRAHIVTLEEERATAMDAVKVIEVKIQNAELRLSASSNLSTSGKAAYESAAGM